MPARRLRARLAARRRREDVEVQAHRHRADRDHRRLRLRRLPLLLPPRDRVRAGRLLLVGGPVGALPGRARERLRQPRLAHDGDDRALLRGHRACPPGTYAERDLAVQRIVADAATAADAAIERFRIDEAIAAIWTIVDALNGYITENAPWALAKDDAQRERLGTVLYTAAEGLRALAVLLSPVMPIATEKLWIALGAAESLGRLTISRSARPARGAAAARHAVNALAPLFPRVEQRYDDRRRPVRPRAHAGGPRRRALPTLPSPWPCRSTTTTAISRSPTATSRSPSTSSSTAPRRSAIAAWCRPGATSSRAAWSAWAAASDPRVLAAVAIHPNEAPATSARPAGRGDRGDRRARRAAACPGDRRDRPGLLPHRRGRPARAVRNFEAHIALAKKHGIAMQIHDRDAHDAVLETLERVGAPDRRSSTASRGRRHGARAADAGYYLSFAGNLTFKNAQNLRDALAVTPRDRILVETDAPFLTPIPHRGRPNAPYLVPVTVRFMAAELGVDLDELCAQWPRTPCGLRLVRRLSRRTSGRQARARRRTRAVRPRCARSSATRDQSVIAAPEGEPPRRCQPPGLGDQAAEQLADDQAAEDADHVDRGMRPCSSSGTSRCRTVVEIVPQTKA